MDRNYIIKITEITPTVALRKESVDRNLQKLAEAIKPSVALRKESVDRNYSSGLFGVDTVSSLSARRAWIEILEHLRSADYVFVALRKESVDRNGLGVCYYCDDVRRSPQGERG